MPTNSLHEIRALVSAIRRRMLADPTPGGPDRGDVFARQLEAIELQTGQRLKECLRAQGAGDVARALALAEEPPALPSVVALLDSTQPADWRELCRRNRWAVAPGLDAGDLSGLAALYAEETKEEQVAVLRDQLRVAMLTRDHERALELARRLGRLLPDDVEVADQRAGLEVLVAGRFGGELRALLAEERGKDVVALMARMEELGIAAASPEAERAGEIRRRLEAEEADGLARGLVGRLASLIAARDWRPCETVLEEVRRLETSCGVVWDAGQQRTIARAGDLVTQGRADSLRREAREESLRRLESALRAGEDSLQRRPVREAAVEAADSALRTAAESARGHGDPLPADVTARTEALLAKLGDARNHARRRQRLTRGAVAGVALLVILVAATQAIRSIRAAQTAAEIEQFVEGRLEDPLRRLLDELRSAGRIPDGPARLTGAAAAAGEWLQRIDAARATASGLLRELEAMAAADFQGRPAHDVLRAWSAFESACTGLSSEAAAALAAEAAPLKARLDEWLAARRGEAAQLAEEKLQQLAGVEAGLAAAVTAADLRPAVRRADEILGPLRPWMDPAAAQLQLPEATRAALADAEARVGKVRGMLESLDAATRGLREAKGLPDFAAALGRVGAVPLEGAGEIAAARSLPAAKLDQHALLGAMLMPGDPGLWATLRSEPDFARKLHPDDALQSEIDALDRMARNDNLAGIREVTVTPRDRTIYLRGQPITDRKPDPRTRKIALEIYDPKVSPRAEFKTVQVDRNLLSYAKGEFLAKDRISPASHVINSLKLEQMTDPERQGFRKSILEMADLVLAWRDSMPPEVAAYLLQSLGNLGQEPPDQGRLRWGLGWSPSFEDDMGNLRRALPPLDGSEWMSPADESVAGAMQQFFATRAPVSYAREAVLHQRLALEGFRGGLVLRGFVDAAGSPQLTERETGKPEVLWGFEDGTLEFKPLLRVDPGLAGTPAQLAAPAPLTPLVASRLDLERTMESAMTAAGIRVEDRGAYLPKVPPLFAPLPPAP